MRKAISALLLAAFLLPAPAARAAASFADLPSSSPYATAFTYLAQKNIVRGFPDGTARPGAPLSRVEGLVAVLHMCEKYAPQVVWFTENLPNIPLFPDLDQSAWYAPFVEVGFLEGVVKGTNDGKFHPANSLTVEQALLMLHRAYGTEKEVTYRASDRIGNIPGQWFTDAVSWAIDRNLIAPGEYISLGTPITRGQFFAILYRLHSAEAKGLYAYKDDPSTIATLKPSSLPAFQPSNSLSSVAPRAKEDQTLLPLPVTPLPFGSNDPFNLPPPGTTFGPPPPPALPQYASAKDFAISIPSLNILDVTVTHPDDPFSKEGILAPLKVGLGHLFALPGNPGKTMIYGHSSGYPWDVSEYTKVFRQINKLVAGERVYITYQGKLTIYEVTGKQVIDAKDITPFNDDGSGEELILYTCWPPDSIKQRYLVHAMPVETVALR